MVHPYDVPVPAEIVATFPATTVAIYTRSQADAGSGVIAEEVNR